MDMKLPEFSKFQEILYMSLNQLLQSVVDFQDLCMTA